MQRSAARRNMGGASIRTTTKMSPPNFMLGSAANEIINDHQSLPYTSADYCRATVKIKKTRARIHALHQAMRERLAVCPLQIEHVFQPPHSPSYSVRITSKSCVLASKMLKAIINKVGL